MGILNCFFSSQLNYGVDQCKLSLLYTIQKLESSNLEIKCLIDSIKLQGRSIKTFFADQWFFMRCLTSFLQPPVISNLPDVFEQLIFKIIK